MPFIDQRWAISPLISKRKTSEKYAGASKVSPFVAFSAAWCVKPDLIIETGIAHGGSLIMSASMLALIDYCDGVKNNAVIDPKASRR